MSIDAIALSPLAMQNDAFRAAMGAHPVYRGRFVGTVAVRALSQQHLTALLTAVRTFTYFSDENDPEGIHDFGAIEIAGMRWFFKIDCFDGPTCEFGSETPTDPNATYRVLTVMHEDEW